MSFHGSRSDDKAYAPHTRNHLPAETPRNAGKRKQFGKVPHTKKEAGNVRKATYDAAD